MEGNSARARGLESFKKEAKRWLKAIDSGDAQALARLTRALGDTPRVSTRTLRDVQHALAREAGYAGWTDLKSAIEAREAQSATGTIGAATLERYEDMASALLDAYRTGSPEAMERHYAYTWHRRPWRGMRTYVQLDLGKRPVNPGDDVEITIDDARKLVALEYGFADWDALRAFTLDVAESDLPQAAKAIRIRLGSADDRREVISSRDWSAVVAALAEQGGSRVDANGQAIDAALALIANISSVRELQLSNSRAVTDVGVRSLAPLTNLQHLDLSMTGVTDDGLEVVRQFPNLESINLSWTRVTDAGVAHLAECQQLERVNLLGTHTGNGALRALANKPRLSVLQTGTRVTDAGVALLHEFPAFKNSTDAEPDFRLTRFEVDAHHLVLRGEITDSGLAALAGLEGLLSLNVDDQGLRFSPSAVAKLVSVAKLMRLAITAFDETMPAIASLPRVRHLIIQDTVAGDAGFVALSHSRSIEAIWGRRCENLRAAGFVALANMPALRALAVSCVNVDDSALAALPSFPALRELMPMDVPDEGYRHIGRCTDLETLTLMYCRETGDRATEHITGMSKLRRYFASYTRATDRTPELLATIDSLEELEMYGIPGITDAGIAKLARLPRLRTLNVSGQNISAAVADPFPAHVKVTWEL